MDTFVAKHLQGVSRTYAIVVPMLPEPLAETVGVAYLLMRIVDTLEDDPDLCDEERCRLLDALDAALDDRGDAGALVARPLGTSAAERALMHDAPQILARVHALPGIQRQPVGACARAMSAGVRRLLARSKERGVPYPAVRDLTELREYCYYVAGVVGEMLCELMAQQLAHAGLRAERAAAVELGLGLQLVNIIKDVLADADAGRRYLPPAERGASGTAANLPRAVLDEARGCLRRGIAFVLALPPVPPGLRSFSGVPLAWGALTLAQAERDPRNAKIDRAAIQSTIAQFDQLAGDESALAAWLGTLLGGPAGADELRRPHAASR